MLTTGLVRTTLWITFPFNFLAAGILAFPASTLGQLVGLPADGSPIYRALCAFMVALFGVMYAWMATQKEIPRAFVVLGAVGKTGVFVIASALWLSGNASINLVALASVDQILAAIWFRWLLVE